METKDSTELKLAVQRLEQSQTYSAQLLDKMSKSLNVLVTLQKDHAVLRIEIKTKQENTDAAVARTNVRMEKMEATNTWVIRLVVGAIILKVLSVMWGV